MADLGPILFAVQLSIQGNQFTNLTSTITVPPVPPTPTEDHATYFLWPGIQPGTNGNKFLPIDNGVLQPVLTFGPTCAPNQTPQMQKSNYAGWAVSAQYVNTFGKYPGYMDCLGGPFMDVQPGDNLVMEISLIPGTTRWYQKVTVAGTKKSVDYTIDMLGQGQGVAEWIMELYGLAVPFDYTVRDIYLEVEKSGDEAFCKEPFNSDFRNVTCATPVLSKDGKKCMVSSCTYKAPSSGKPVVNPITTSKTTTAAAKPAVTTATSASTSTAKSSSSSRLSPMSSYAVLIPLLIMAMTLFQ
ncbi:hypothetical protein HDU99_001866 [Rhizoclosmatium hyalinum]|nr:hypothetical protein HDU99_001866 [Rhizoclosmatium hyalinum]